jgi:RNA polymerase sigma-70 factor, ECF subfamily
MSLNSPASGSPAARSVPALGAEGDETTAHLEQATLGAKADDQALLALIAAGDEIAFRCFARRHVAKSLAIAQRVTGNVSDAEEVVQDAMFRVWRHAADWRRNDARVTTWLYRIVVNLAIDCVRKRQGRSVPIEEAGDPADPTPSAETALEGRELAAFMAAAIDHLPIRQRTALMLCYGEGLECAAAAAVMKVSVSAMESLLVRARRQLRHQLDQSAGTENDKGTAARSKPGRSPRVDIAEPAPRVLPPLILTFAAS